MTKKECTITYPRKRFARAVVRALGRMVLPLAFELEISGRDRFPQGGPLIIVGNHVAAMEGVLMIVFTPWQVELLGTADIPVEKITEIAGRLFGFIPINRGHMDRPAMNKALDVLRQNGVIGIFPEGGIWDAGAMRPQKGVAWLSYRASAPVLPVGFSGTLGAIGKALKMQRPRLEMNVGDLISAARLPEGRARKVYFEEFSALVMGAVRDLLPAADETLRPVVDERFELEIAARDTSGETVSHPMGLEITHKTALAKLLHRPTILKIFRANLRLPIDPLQNLDSERDGKKVADAVELMLNYLREENPYLLAYRFGPREGRAMQDGLEELLALARWAARSGLALEVTPTRRYYSPEQEKEIVQIKQGAFGGWM